VEALVVSVTEGLRRQDPGAEVTFTTPWLEYDAVRDTGARAMADAFRKIDKSKKSLPRRLAKSILRPRQEPDHESFRAIRDADAVVALGGDVFSSDYNSLEIHLDPLRYARAHGVPTAMLGHSIGPFKEDLEKQMWSEEAHLARLITVRESKSLNYVVNDCGISKDRVKLTSDPAFLLATSEPACTDRMLAHLGLPGGTPFVALAISQGITAFRQIDSAQHLQTWLKLCRMITDDLGYSVLLVPHVQDNVAPNDDRILATQMLRQLNFDPRVRLAGADFSARELKAMISRSVFFVAERMHAGIAGLSTGVPGLLVSYSVKAEGITADLFSGENRARCCITLDRFMDAEVACAAAREVHSNRSEISRQLHERLPAVKAAADENYRLLVASLR